MDPAHGSGQVTAACLALLYLILAVTCQANDTWLRNTFPGPGHQNHPGPWEPGQGSDRTEWVTTFGVSPVDGDFMLQSTDIGRVVMTTDGTEFVASRLPIRAAGYVAFHPQDGNTAYVMGQLGWYRTEDQGDSWNLFWPKPETSSHPVGRPWGKRTLVVDPHRPGHIYIATYMDGLVRTTDNGDNWETVAFDGRTIRALAMAVDGSVLYLIAAGYQSDPDSALARAAVGELWRMEDGDPETLTQIGTTADHVDVEVHPTDPSRGWYIRGIYLPYSGQGGGPRLTPFSSWGEDVGSPLFDATPYQHGISLVRVNPANGDHLVILCGRGPDFWPQLPIERTLYWSDDGGLEWHNWETDGQWLTAIVDYAPFNHRSAPLYHYNIEAYSAGRAYGYDTIDFLPGNASSVVAWGFTGMRKGPLRSDDHGAHFTPFAHGGNFKLPVQMSFGSSDSVIAIARGEYGFQLSDDGGLSWRGYCYLNDDAFPPPQDGHGYWGFQRAGWGIAIDPLDDSVVVGAYGNNPCVVMRSENFGMDWTVVAEQDSFYNSAVRRWERGVFWNRQDPDFVYTCGLVSQNGGQTWSDWEPWDYAVILAISISNSNLLFGRSRSPLSRGVSLDGGDTWTPIARCPKFLNTSGDSVSVIATQGLRAAIDPRPEHDPTLGGGRRLRILCPGRGGMWVYNAADSTGAQGTWTLSDSGIVTHSGHFTPWLKIVVFDPRPEYHHIVYAAGKRIEYQPFMEGTLAEHNDNLPYRQVYRSIDGGNTWEELHEPGYPGLPEFLDPGELAVSPHSGHFYVQDWTGQYSLPIIGPSGIGDEGEPPTATKSIQVFPNPFNSRTTIEFTLERRAHVTLAIYDLRGRHVATLVDGLRQVGRHTVGWDGMDGAGHALASGMYHARLQTTVGTNSVRLMFVK